MLIKIKSAKKNNNILFQLALKEGNRSLYQDLMTINPFFKLWSEVPTGVLTKF